MPNYTCLSGTALKRFACIAMLLDHIGASCLEVGLGIPYLTILNISKFSQFSTDPTIQRLILLNCILRCIGRFAMPIFAFFVVEGFLHTKNASHYLLRLICFGLISEPMFDFAFFKHWYYPANQNIYATLALGLLALILMHKWEEASCSENAAKGLLAMVPISIALVITVLAADWLRTDYGTAGVLLILALYLLHDKKALQSGALALCTLDQFPAPFAAVPLALYDGTRGNCTKGEQWAFYLFYPVHLLILGITTNFIL